MTGPTYLTLLRMILAVLFTVFAMIPHSWAKITALALFILAAVTDKIDGVWARSKNLVTDLGAFLDPLADKMLVNLAFLVLVYLGVVPLWIFAIILVRDFAVDGMRMMAAKNGITISASFLGKLKTTFQMVALSIILFNLIMNNGIIGIIGNTVLYLAVFMTVFSGADYLIKGYQRNLKATKR